MDEYLTYTKRRLSELETIDKVHVVLGNESCDLDSAVAALTYAFYLHHKSVKDPGVLYLPVLNITSNQYRLRTETVYFLGRLNIKQTDLTFRDDVDLPTLKAIGKLDLTLVDHNVLVVHDQSLEDMVTTVIDHRPRDRQEQAGVRVVIDLVGSCCTLIAEELLSDPDFNLNHQVALLLYGTILIDTVNRSVAAGKLTQRDEAVLQRLEGVLQDVNGDQLYEDIQMAKCDLSGLTTMEILEKDMKMVSGTSMTVAMSSVSVDIQELLSRDCLTSDLETFCQQKGCPVLVVMSISVTDEDNIYRQLAVFSTNRIFREQICDVLDLSTNPNLQLEPVAISLDNISIFRQGNVKASRKKVLPVIKAFLNGDKTPDITSKEFASETQQAAAKVTEGFSSFSNLLDTNTTSMQNQSFFTESNETNKQLFSKDDLDPFGAMNSDDTPVKERQSMNLVTDSFDPYATSSMQNQSEDESYFTVSNETQFSDADFNPFDVLSNDDKPIKEEHDTNLVDIQNFDPFKTISNSESNEWQSGSEVGSLDPWSSSGKSESVLKQSGSGLHYFDTFIDPVQDQSVAAEHPAVSDSTPVQSKAQIDDFELMTPTSLKEEAVSQSGISAHVDLVNLDQDNSASDRNLSANTNQPLLDYRLFNVGESSGEDLKNSWANPFLASQEVSFTDNAQLSPYESVNVSDLFKNNSLENLKFDQYRGGSHAEQDDRNVFDSLELNEADFFDQINTPDYQSGVSTPLINSGISTPFESLHANHSGRNSESESGYPTITQTPPHSFTESGMANLNKDHVLPSFNSSEMVERIQRKKASLHGATEINFNSNSVPYTPQNSFIEGTFDALMIDRDLPSFDNSEFVQKIHEKRSSLAGIHEDDMDSEASQYPYAPHNSFIGGTFDKYAHENLSSLNDAEAVESVREKQAALAFFSGSDNLSTQNESLHTESPSFGSVESNNPFLVNIESDASSSTNPFLFMDNGLLPMEEFISPFTPQNNFPKSNLHFMENRDSSIESELTETHSRKLPLIMDDENFENVAAQNPTFENFENVAAQDPTFENFENVAAQNPAFENFENVAAQNPTFENFEENLNSMQTETEEIEKDVCQTDSLDNKFKEQEGQGEYELKEKSFKEEINDSHLFKDDLFYIETGKEDVLYSGFKSAASTSILDEDDVRLSEISNIWGQDIQQQDVVNNDNLDSGNLHVTTGKSKPDELDGEYQLIEYSNAQTEASSDNDEKLENECDTRSEEDLLGSRDTEEIQEIAYSIAGEIIQTVLDNFPDLHIPSVAKTLQEVESKSLEEGSELPNKSEGESIFSLETEYLPNMDPLGGNMELVTSPSFSAQDQDNEFGDVETVSFHRASHEEYHADSLYQGDTAHSATSLFEGLPSVPEVIIEASQVFENETLVFVPHKLGSDHISNQQVVSSDMASLSHATAVNLESTEKVNKDQLVMNIEQTKALEKQNLDSCEPDLDLVLPEVCSVSTSFVPVTNIEIAQQLDSETQNLVTQQPDMESVSHQPDSEWISVKASSDLLLSQPVSEDILSLSDDAGDGFASNIMISEDQSMGTGLNNVPQDDYEAGEQNSLPDGSVLESFRNDLITNENEVSGEKSSSEIESIMNEKILDLAGNIVNSVLASAIECTMGGSMKSNVKRHVVSEESIDFSPVSTSLEDDVIEFASETEIDHIETVLETEISCIGAAGDRKIFHIESAFETDIPDREIQCEKEMSQSTQATNEDTVQTSEADGEIRHDSSDSEDSDTSSTTTEGSYRIEDPGVTYPPEMLYDTMDTVENSDLGQETPANYLLAEEVIKKVNIPDLAASVGYSYTSKMDELCHMSELQDISGVPDTEDKYAVTEIVENSDLLEKQDYSSLIDLDDIPSNQHTEISSADSQTGTDIKEIWELQDQNGYIVEPYVRQTAEKDEKVQTWDGFEESVADTQNSNNSALVVGPKQDEIESLSAYHTTEKNKEEDTVSDLMTLVVHKKEKLKGGYSFDLPIPFVIIQEAADDLPSEEESPSPPSAGKKSSNTADNATQTNKRTATETVKDECENLVDIALTYSVSHESELTGRKQREDDAFLSKDDSTIGLKSQHADDIPIEIMLEETRENVIEEEHRLQEGSICKESVCLEMSASEIDAGSFDENRLGKDTDMQEKSVAVELEITSFEQSKMDEEYIVTDYKTAKESGAFKSQSTDIMADSTGKDFEKTYDVETETKSTEKNKTDEDNAFADLNPVEEHDTSKMELSFKAAETTSNNSEKSYFPEIKSPEGNNMDQDNTIAAFQLAEESDSFRSQSTEMKVDSTCKDSEKSFTAEFRTKSPEEIKIGMNNTVAEFKHVEEPSASKSQSVITNADSKSKDSEKSLTAEAETMSPEENKMYEDSMFTEESNVFKILTSDNTTYSTSTDSKKSSAPTVEIISPEQNQMDVDSTFKDFKPSEESEVSESHLTMITPDSTDEETERSYAVKVETKPPHGNAMDEDNVIADFIPVEESERSYAVKVETKPPHGNAVDEDNVIADFIPVEDSERSYAVKEETKPPHGNAVDEDNVIADFIPVEESERSYAVIVETKPPYGNTVDEDNVIADLIPVEESERSYAVKVETKPPHGNAVDEDNVIADFIPVEESERSYAVKVETKPPHGNAVDEDNVIADLIPVEESERSYAVKVETKPPHGNEVDEDNVIADFIPVAESERSYAVKVETKPPHGNTVDEDNVIADFIPVEESERSYAVKVETKPPHGNTVDEDNVIADFIHVEESERSYAVKVETKPPHGNTVDEDNVIADFIPVEESERSYAVKVETKPPHGNAVDEDNVIADFIPVEESDRSYAVKVETKPPHGNAVDEDDVIADVIPVEETERSYAVKVETKPPHGNAVDDNVIADFIPVEESERSYAVKVETKPPHGNTVDEDKVIADFIPIEEYDTPDSYSAEIAVDSISKGFAKLYAAEEETKSQEENEMDDFKQAEEFGPFTSHSNEIADYYTSTDFKHVEELDAFKHQSAEIAVDSIGADFVQSLAPEVQTKSPEGKQMNEDKKVSDFKPMGEFDASKIISFDNDNVTDITSEMFEKSYAAAVETISAMGENMDEDKMVVDFKSAEDFDAFQSQSAEIAAYSTDTYFENSFVFTDVKPLEEFDAVKMQPSYNAATSASEHFEKSYAAEAETMSSQENTIDEGRTVTDLKSAEEFDVFRSQSTEITVNSTGTDFENSFAFADFKFGDELDASKMQSSYNAVVSTSEHFEESFAAEAETMFTEESKMEEDNAVADFKLKEDPDALKSQLSEITVDSTGKDSEKSSVADGVIQSTQENKMDEDNLISDFILVEESNAPESRSAEITADTTGKSSAKSFVADIETNSLEKHKIDEDNTSADFQPAKESEALKSQSNEIVDFSTGKDFENSFAPEVQTTSPEGRQVDEDKIVADFKPVEELDASERLSSDNVTESTSEHFKKSNAAEVEILFADENKMEEDNTVADFKPAEEFDAFKRQLTEIIADNMGTDFENSSVSEVESKLQEEKKVNNGTSPDFKKLSAAETENKSSVEEKIIEDITVIDPKPAQEYDASKGQSTVDKTENTSEDPNSSVSDIDNRSSVLLRKEVYMTTAGRMSIAIDSTYENMIPEQKEDLEKMTSSMQCPGISTVLEELQPTEPQEKSLKEVENKKRHKRETSVTSLESKEKMRGMDWTQEFYEDPIPGMEAEEVCDSSDDSQVGSSDSEEDDSKPGRPSSLFDERKAKKRIAADVNILNKDESTDDILDDPPTPDDLGDDSGELEWEKRRKLQESQAKTDDTPVTSPSEPLSSQYCARDDDDEDRESHDKSQFRNVQIAGKEHRVDMGVIEPYKKVLSHGGYYGDGLNAIILFSGCYLPDRSRRDYQYVMDNLFLYVISTLELLVAEDYLIVYFHGATPRRQMPSFGWLKKCYQTIDRRLKKNLKTLLLVHPTLWLKTVVMMTKPFISSKFSSKLRFVKTLRELATIIPMEYIYVPEPVQLYDDRLRNSTSISTPSSSSSDTTTPR